MKKESLKQKMASFCTAAYEVIKKGLKGETGLLKESKLTPKEMEENKAKRAYLDLLSKVAQDCYCLGNEEVYKHTIGLKHVKDTYGYCDFIPYAHYTAMQALCHKLTDLSRLYHEHLGFKKIDQLADAIHDDLKVNSDYR